MIKMTLSANNLIKHYANCRRHDLQLEGSFACRKQQNTANLSLPRYKPFLISSPVDSEMVPFS